MHVKLIMNRPLKKKKNFRTRSKEIIYILFPHLKKKVGLFSDTIKARSFKCCMTITVLGLYIVILGLMTSPVSGSQVHQKHKLHIVFFLFLSTAVHVSCGYHAQNGLCDSSV